MGLFRTQKENEVVHIRGPCLDASIRVSYIGGTLRDKKVELRVRGIPGLETVTISNSDGLVELMEGIEIGVRDDQGNYFRKVDLHYRVSQAYTVSWER